MEKRATQRNFRPWPDVQERLEVAEDLGLNVSQLINEVLERYLSEHLQAKAKRIRTTLEAPSK
jgi:hypothetical protein